MRLAIKDVRSTLILIVMSPNTHDIHAMINPGALVRIIIKMLSKISTAKLSLT